MPTKMTKTEKNGLIGVLAAFKKLNLDGLGTERFSVISSFKSGLPIDGEKRLERQITFTYQVSEVVLGDVFLALAVIESFFNAPIDRGLEIESDRKVFDKALEVYLRGDIEALEFVQFVRLSEASKLSLDQFLEDCTSLEPYLLAEDADAIATEWLSSLNLNDARALIRQQILANNDRSGPIATEDDEVITSTGSDKSFEPIKPENLHSEVFKVANDYITLTKGGHLSTRAASILMVLAYVDLLVKRIGEVTTIFKKG